MKKNKVLASKFIQWYFDNDIINDLGSMVATSLFETGEFKIDAQEVFDQCGYIPLGICENDDASCEDEEYDPSEVEFINDYIK